MANGFVLQDWITVGVGVASGVATQTEARWVDLADFQDVVFFTSCANVTVGVPTTLSFQTAPTADNDLFRTMTSLTLSAGTLTQSIVRFQTATTPLARFVRWQLTASAVTVATIRIHMDAATRGGKLAASAVRA